jgi:glutathione synthase
VNLIAFFLNYKIVEKNFIKLIQKKMKILIQMDDIFSINVASDSTYKIMIAGQNKGHEIFYYTPADLQYHSQSQQLKAKISKVKLEINSKNYCQIIEQSEKNLNDFDVILIRQDPPYNMNYLTTTYLLEKLQKKVLILNHPQEIRNCPEKIFVTEFENLTPPTLISSDFLAIKKFHLEYKKIIVKPLYACGGEGVVMLDEDSPNLMAIVELMLKNYQTPIIAQKFLEAVKDGDKRLILIDGEFVGGITRVAKKGEIRSNLHIGGSAEKLVPSKRDLEICKIISSQLKQRNLFFVGIDIIGDYLTEINVTSPTGISEINKLANIDIAEIFINKLQEKLIKFKQF